MSAPVAAHADRQPAPPTPIARAAALTKHYKVGRANWRRRPGAVLRAVDGVDFAVERRRTMGLVGESGSGKSTIARLMVGLTAPTSGQLTVGDVDLSARSAEGLRRLRSTTQLVFQDPFSSFDPMAALKRTVVEPAIAAGISPRGDGLARDLFDRVGLRPELIHRRPHELSGGQLQRAAVARALSIEPPMLVLDEPVSALDVSTQAQVINLLADLQQEVGLSYLFIAHNLAVVRQLSHEVAVLYLGRIAEVGPVDSVFESPGHPYTLALLSSVLEVTAAPQRRRPTMAVSGETPSPISPPGGCRFHTRCPWAMAMCATEPPAPYLTAAGSTAHCHLHVSGPRLEGESVRVLLGERSVAGVSSSIG